MYREEKIATYTSKGRRIQLLKLTEIPENNNSNVMEITNTVGGFIIRFWNTEETIKIKDKEVQKYAEKYGLIKNNENYYYNPVYPTNYANLNNRYQIRINRKIEGNYIYESQAAKIMANIIASELLQQKICFNYEEK